MKISVRAIIHGDPLKETVDTIHKVFSEEIIRGLSEMENPRSSGGFAESWASERKSPETTEITNRKEVDGYNLSGLLLGTGIWGESKKPFAHKEYYWRAAGRMNWHSAVRGINPRRIALSISQDVLNRVNEALKHGGSLYDDSYKQETYDFALNVEESVRRGAKIAVRRLT